jgi:hypothetical protein
MVYRNPAVFTAAIAAAILGALLPVFSHMAVWLGTGQTDRLFEEPDILVFQAILASAAFWLFAALARFSDQVRSGSLVPIFSGMAIVLGIWGWATTEGYRYQANPESTGGANIGLGLVILATPLIIFIVMFIAEFLLRQKQD